MGSTEKLLDVLIIGGGPSGLSTALGLARQLYTAVVFDSGEYRNERATHMHNVVTWDHHSPAEYRAKGRKDLVTRYNTIQLEDVAVKSVQKLETGIFQALDAKDRKWLGRTIVLATGVTDLSPDIDGYSECWARGIFHCLFCHGYEERGCESAGILAIGDCAALGPALHLARMARRLTPKATVYTDGSEELSKILEGPLATAGMHLDTRRISRLIKGPNKTEVIMEFEDGTSKTEGFLVHKPKTEVKGPFAEQLSLELTDEGDIRVKAPFYETTSVPGAFAVGDSGSAGKAVAQAAATGLWCASGLVMKLSSEPAPELPA